MRFYRLLLRLYPASFRREYQHELEASFAQRTQGASPVSRIATAVTDVVPNALAAHAEILRRDLGYALRAMRRAPGFAVTVALVVALGVGANAAAFSLADFVFLRPLPFKDPGRLVQLWETSQDFGQNQLSPANYRDWKTMSKSFAGVGAYWRRAQNLVGSAEPRRLETAAVEADLFDVLGVPPLVGRRILASDTSAGATPVVVISYALWQGAFGADPGVVGKAVQLDGIPHVVVGVMPPTFSYPSRDFEAWTPLALRGTSFEDRTDTFLDVIGRLGAGVTLDQARRDLNATATRLRAEYPKELEDVSAGVVPLHEQVSGRARALVWGLCGAALCILLLACANVASLFLARATSRVRELAVRTALGAGREQLMRQIATESIALSVLGGAAGVALAWWTVPLLTQLVPQSLPVASAPTVDARVLAFALVLMVVTGLVFGVGPAIGAGRTSALDALRSGVRTGGGRTRRVRSMLVVVEISASVVLLILSGLLIRSVWNIQSLNPGFVADNVMTLRTALPRPRYDVVAVRARYYESVLDGIRALPGVQSAGFVTGLPMAMRGGIWGARIPGVTLKRGEGAASARFVTPGYFSAMGIALMRGRDIASTDLQSNGYVVVVSESFAKRLWPNEDALGKRFIFADSLRTIVGIVGDVRFRGLEQPSEPQVYMAYKQVPDSNYISYYPKDLAVRSSVPGVTLLPAIRRIIRAADPDQPISHVRSLTQILDGETASRVTQLRLLEVLAAIGLLIAGIGIHGLLAFTVSRRAQEMGVRRALGAQSGGIAGLVVGEGMRLAAVGVTIGVLFAYLAARGMSALLLGVSPNDPATIIAAAALCFAVAVVGCLRPALSAARVDPMNALRSD